MLYMKKKSRKRELLPIQVDFKISYNEKTRSLRFFKTTLGGSSQRGRSGFRNIVHYACIILSKKMKFKYQLVYTDSEKTTDIKGT